MSVGVGLYAFRIRTNDLVSIVMTYILQLFPIMVLKTVVHLVKR